MSRLDELANNAPVATTTVKGTTPVPDFPAKGPTNAFTEVTILQLYFFLWKWTAASLLFALPFIILRLVIQMLFRL
ncbi:MAG TPA: hypothetical protein VE604_10540 [Candidatus Polarisedimenticolia bacterium]|nr:hypothetical protein [Candidatus Polarisedimenticolia bacterium]